MQTTRLSSRKLVHQCNHFVKNTLPFSDATAVNGYSFSGALLPIFFDNIDCNLNSLSILNCSYRIIGERICGIHETAGVICQVCNEGAIRLLTSNGEPIETYNTSEETKGIVQFCVDNEWVVICDTVNFWTKYEAKLVCQQLGYSSQGIKGIVHLILFSFTNRCNGITSVNGYNPCYITTISEM